LNVAECGVRAAVKIKDEGAPQLPFPRSPLSRRLRVAKIRQKRQARFRYGQRSMIGRVSPIRSKRQMTANWTTTRKTNVAIAVALALSGCAQNPFPVIQSTLGDLKGRPVKTVVEKLGDPDEQIHDGDEKAYVWYRVNKPRQEFLSNLVECTIKVFVDKDDKITGFFYSGNNAGCGRYAHKLDDSYQTPRGVLNF
jgi:hypothetical protein